MTKVMNAAENSKLRALLKETLLALVEVVLQIIAYGIHYRCALLFANAGSCVDIKLMEGQKPVIFLVQILYDHLHR